MPANPNAHIAQMTDDEILAYLRQRTANSAMSNRLVLTIGGNRSGSSAIFLENISQKFD